MSPNEGGSPPSLVIQDRPDVPRGEHRSRGGGAVLVGNTRAQDTIGANQTFTVDTVTGKVDGAGANSTSTAPGSTPAPESAAGYVGHEFFSQSTDGSPRRFSAVSWSPDRFEPGVAIGFCVSPLSSTCVPAWNGPLSERRAQEGRRLPVRGSGKPPATTPGHRPPAWERWCPIPAGGSLPATHVPHW